MSGSTIKSTHLVVDQSGNNALNKSQGGYEFFRLPIHDINFKKSNLNKTKTIIPDSFIGASVGKTGAGKTTIIESLLCHNKAWKNKYKKIIYINPNERPALNDDIDKESIIWLQHFDIASIRQILKQIDEELDEDILDDEQQELIEKMTKEKNYWVNDKCLTRQIL